jgi:hypothetical protein
MLSALLAALALHFAARGATPVDAAMPFVGVVIVVLAWRCSALIEACVPLLVAAAIAFPEERMRLFAFGIIVAGAFAAAVATVPRRFVDCAAVTIAAVLVLRWIPLGNVEVVREVIVLLGALAVLSARPPIIVGAVAVALVTPTHPGKALLYPFVVAAIVFLVPSPRERGEGAASAADEGRHPAGIAPHPALTRHPLPAWRGEGTVVAVTLALLTAAHFARAEHAPLWVAAAVAVAMPLLARARVALPAYVAAIALVVLWPWSGLVARAMPSFFRAAPPSPRAQTIGVALAASQSIDIAVPPGTRRAIVVASGANVARLKEGRAIGSVNDTPIRIGDVADFGFMRREQFFMARNPLPARPVADIRGYGQAAFLYGAGVVVVPGAESLHISAAADLPANARLQVESVAFE